MATRPAFLTTNEKPFYVEQNVEFTYCSGFALSQKQKSIDSLHKSLLSQNKNLHILEVSRHSGNPLGYKLSAFNLMLYDKQKQKQLPVECIFQSSKVFELGGPYVDLLEATPKDAKTDSRLKNSGNLIAFEYHGVKFPLEPKTIFYDWIYISTLSQHQDLLNELKKYNAFTDIEFNPKKSINCQARSCAISVGLLNAGLLDEYMNNFEKFKTLYNCNIDENFQLSLF